MTARQLQTVDEVIDALGGTTATAKLTAREPQHVSNWRKEQRIAAETFLIFKAQLGYRRLTAPSSLWGIKKPPRKKSTRRPRAVS